MTLLAFMDSTLLLLALIWVMFMVLGAGGRK